MRSAAWEKALRVTLRRFARRAIVALGVVVVVALVALLSLLVYLQSGPGRSLLAAKVNALVSGELVGELRIERIDVLSRDRLVVSSASLFDTKGRVVARVQGLRARLDLWPILKSALLGPALDVKVPSVHAERLEIGLYRTETGGLSLASALQTRPSHGPQTPSSSKGPLVQLPAIDIDSVSVRTDFGGLSAASAEVRALKANFAWSKEAVAVGLTSHDARVLQVLALDANVQLAAQVRVPGVIDASLDGLVGPMPLQASFRKSGDDLTLLVSSSSLSPEAMRKLVPGWPLLAPLSARVELSGPWAALHARVEVQAGASHLEASGPFAFAPNVGGELALTGRELDLRLVAADVPETALGVEGKLVFSLAAPKRVELNSRWAKGELFGVSLPETAIVAVYAENQLSGTATSNDPKLPVRLDFTLPAQGAPKLRAQARDLDLAALSPYGLSAQGRADLDATAEFSAAEVDARAEARVRSLRLSPVLAETMLVRARLRGPLSRAQQLAVELEVEGEHLALGPSQFAAFALESQGELGRQRVAVRAGPKSKPTLQASTTLGFEHGLSASDTRLVAELNGVKHELELKSARVAARALELRELHWQIGAGSLSGSVRLDSTRKVADLETRGLEAEAVLKTLALDPSSMRGRLDANLHFAEDGRARQGQLQAQLVAGAVPGVGAFDAQLIASVADGDVEGQGSFVLPELAQGKLTARGTIAKSPLTLRSLARALGEVRLAVSEVDLAAVSRRWLPEGGVALSGLGAGSVTLSKPDGETPATLSYAFETRELGLRGHHSSADGMVRYGDISSHGRIGASKTDVQIELKDAAGTWLTGHAEHSVGLAALVSVFRSSSPALLLDAPFQAEFTARPRSLELLDAGLPRAFSGEVAASLEVSGSLRQPELSGALNATGLGTDREPSGKLALGFDYSAEREEYALKAHYADGANAKLEFDGGGHWGWFGHGFGQGWSARGDGRIEHIELGPIADLLGVPLTGEAAGRASIRASPSEFEASGELKLARLSLERRPLGDGSATVRVRQGLADAQLSVAGKDTSFELSSEVGLCWDAGPCIDSRRGGSVDVKVRNYQLATFAPLLRSAASDIRGRVNGFVTLAWDAVDGAAKPKTRLRADAMVTEGSMTLTAGAGSIQRLELRALGNGEETLQLTLKGCVHSNDPNLRATADVSFAGAVPQRVDAELLVVNKVPVSFEGVRLGTATIDAKAKPARVVVDLSGERRSVEANIPALDFLLPVKDDTRLVDLTEDPAIHITDEKSAPVPEAQTAESSPWTVSVKLGSAVSIKQPGMRVPVTGSLTQSPDGLLDGSIILPEGGVVPQLGQIFRLKRGSVRFNHQPLKSGELSIEASTRTADGVVVELYVSGTLEKPAIRLRSDPPRSENDIVALLLGLQGSDTVNSNGQPGTARSSATALAMNQLLRGSALAGVQFGGGQTQRGDSVSTVSMRAFNSPVWLEGRTVRSTTQRAANSGVQSSGVIDWRFAQGFSLRTQLGNISGVELRWSHRY